MPRILDAALSTLWAITPDGLDALRSIYEQALSRTGSVSIEEIDRIINENEDIGMSLHLTNGVRSGQPYNGTSKYTYMFDNGVAVMNLIGPIYPRANMMTSSGAVSLQQFTKEFVMAYDDPEVKGIVMNIDSPGGDARGLGDASNLMYQYSKKRKKPVKSFASGYMASAAYYIGSISQEIIGSQSSIVGSIGTVLSAKAKGQGEYEIVSSQSPYKRPDPASEDGRGVMQMLVDDLAQVFGEDVAKFRGIPVSKVWSDYGQGATPVGLRAKKQGLLDSIGTLDSVIEKVAEEAQTKSFRQVSKKKVSAELAEILTFTTQEKEDMGLKDLVSRFAASNQTIEDEENEQAQPDNATLDESTDETAVDESGQGQETPGNDVPDTPTQSREELEEKFSVAAELFATQMTVDSRILPVPAITCRIRYTHSECG
jgi:ClpP class serine protease